jgi:hypothetical protein
MQLAEAVADEFMSDSEELAAEVSEVDRCAVIYVRADSFAKTTTSGSGHARDIRTAPSLYVLAVVRGGLWIITLAGGSARFVQWRFPECLLAPDIADG